MTAIVIAAMHAKMKDLTTHLHLLGALEPDRRSDRVCAPIPISEGLQFASAKMQTIDRCQRLPFGCAVCSLAQVRSMTP